MSGAIASCSDDDDDDDDEDVMDDFEETNLDDARVANKVIWNRPTLGFPRKGKEKSVSWNASEKIASFPGHWRA